MSALPKLRLIVSGGPAASAAKEGPTLGPPRAADRLLPPDFVAKRRSFRPALVFSLVLHGAVLAAAAGFAPGEERAAGGTDDTIVIEGVSIELLDSVPSVPVPAHEIVTADATEPVPDEPIAPEETAKIPEEKEIPPLPLDGEATEPLPEETARVASQLPATALPDEPGAPTATLETPAPPVPDQSPQPDVAVNATAGEPAPLDPSPADESAATDAVEAAQASPDDTAAADHEMASAALDADTPATTEDAQPKSDRPVEADQAPPVDARAIEPEKAPSPSAADPSQPISPEMTVAVAEADADAVPDETPAITADKAPSSPPEVAPAADPPAKKAKVKAARAKAAPPASRASAAATGTKAASGPTKGNSGAGGSSKYNAGTASASSYRSRLVAHLRRYQSYPAGARGLSGTAMVSFTINARGGVVSVRLARSSGAGVLDSAALAMVRRASPFPPIPPGLGSQITAQAPIRFDSRR